MIYLNLEALRLVAERVLPEAVIARDVGLLESALLRPQATVFGEDAYPDLDHKASALLHSLIANHALVEGNERLALAATIVFLAINGQPLTLSNDEAYALATEVVAGELVDVSVIAARLRAGA